MTEILVQDKLFHLRNARMSYIFRLTGDGLPAHGYWGARLEILMAAINLTNNRTKVNGKSLTQIIARKDALNLQRGAYRSIYYAAAQNTQRARGTEIRVKALLKTADIQKTSDRLAKEVRELDNLLQETNWKTKLIEKP